MRRKKQSRNSSPTPRYLTITIQYWPIPRSVIIVALAIIIFGLLVQVHQKVKIELGFKNYESREQIQFAPPLPSFWQALARPESTKYSLSDVRDPGRARMTNHNDRGVIFHGSRTRKEVALTFDADMTLGMQEMLATGEVESFYDHVLINYLTEANIKATLFFSGLWIETYHKEARELAKNPLFELANHSYSHRSFSGDCYGLGEQSSEEDTKEIANTQVLLKEISGRDTTLFRFPGGCYSQDDIAIAKNAGVIPVQWDVVAHDGFNDDGEAIYHNVVDRVQNGSIIVMHMNGDPNEPQTALVVPRIVDELRARGYTFVTVSELFREHSSHESVLYSSILWND